MDETQDTIDGISAERLWGSDRFATAATIATDHGGNPERVYLATGEDYPDALAAGAVAGASDAPVLLTGSGVLPGSTHSALATLAPDEVVVVGGTAAIGEQIAAAAGEAAGADVRRIAGTHRLDTAAQLADELGGAVDAVYVATGEGFADALAGGAVAGLEGAPLLLTGGETLPPETAEVIEGLDLERIEVLGGTAAIADGVVAELEQLTPATVTRHAGANRFATAAEVVSARVEQADHVFVATGEDYPDALSGGAAAARQGAPLLLTGRDELPAEAGAVLSGLAPASLTVLGGEAAVSEGVLSQASEQVSTAHHRPNHCGGPQNQRPAHCDDGEIAGTVTDSDTGDPIGGATVSTDTGESATTNTDGDYTLAALDPADYDVTADADGFQSATETAVTVEKNTTTTADFVLTSNDGEIAGTVTDSDTGDPIDAATVSTDTGESTTTNTDGDYTLTALDPADYDVTADADGFQPATETAVTVEEDTTTTADFALTPDDGSTAGTSVDRLLSGDVSMDGFTVPAGEVWAFDPDVDTTVETPANVVVKGTLRMRPADPSVDHTLRFINVDESAFQGGGMEVLETDVGLWVTGDGVLDAEGSDKTAWTRSGWDSSWDSTDDVYQLPIAKGEYDAKPFANGELVESVTNDGRTYHAEVVNLTRNVQIQGTAEGNAHVLFMSNEPQTVRNVEVSHVGVEVERDNFTAHQSGRYGLHFHHMGDEARGSLIEGVVVRDAENHAIVPHMSHGMTFRDTITFDTINSAHWWDPGGENATHDTTFERSLSHKVHSGSQHHGSLTAFYGQDGTGNECHDCVATGVSGQASASGFYNPNNSNDTHWTLFDVVAHNNGSNGLYLWANATFTNERGIVNGATVYHNGDAGAQVGAYTDRWTLNDMHAFGNGMPLQVSLAPNCGDSDEACDPDTHVNGGTYDAGGADYAVTVSNKFDYNGRLVFDHTTFAGWTEGAAKLGFWDEKGMVDFVCVDNDGNELEPEQVELVDDPDTDVGTTVRIQQSDGDAYEIDEEGNVSTIEPFANC